MKKHLLLCLALAATTLSSQAQTAVSLTGTPPDASAMFDVSATDKGMLIPRVALTSTAASAPITSPLTSLLVYNTAGVADVTPGYYYWNGTAWTRLLNGATNLSGAGTTNYLARWTPNGNTLGIGVTTDNGTNVGIGSASPTQKLTVAGNINKSGSWIAGDAVWGANTFEIHNSSWDGASNNNYGGITGGHGYYYGGLQSGGGGGNEAASGEFYVSGKSMLMGNVGVGTTTPNFKTDIQQDMTMSGDINPNTAQLSVGGTSTVGKRMLIGYDTNGSGFGFIKAGNYGVAWTNLALQPNGGNVGVGTTAPGFKLHVPSGYIGTDYINTTDNSVGSGVTGVMIKAGDNYLRTGTAAAVATFLGTSLAGNYIQNQNASAQTANYYISGNARVNSGMLLPYVNNGTLSVGGGSIGGNDAVIYAEDQSNNDWGIIINKGAYDYGQDIRVSSGATYGLRVVGSGTEYFRVRGDGVSFQPFIYDINNTAYYLDPNSVSITNDMRANIFYDYGNTGYYVDPNGTSSMNVFTRETMARSSWNALQNNSPVTTRAAQGDNYKTGAMGWGTVDMNTIYSNWGSGFIDSWSSPANGPGASSHYVGMQAFHHNYQDGTNAHGFQMVYAGGSNNRFFWRSGWPGPQAWVEMVHSGNYTSFGDNLGNHLGTTTLNMQGNNITRTGDIISDQNYGMGLVGVYASTRYQNVWAMGTSWRLPADGTTTGNLYGLAWSHPNAGGVAGNLNTHGLLVLENGSMLAAISGSIRARDDMRAPIFYDQNNTGYYGDFAGHSEMNEVYDNVHLTRSTTYGSYSGSETYQGWGWAYNYGYSCGYSCGWWNYSTCYTTCYDYYNKEQINGRAYSYSWANFSDGRLKKNIGTINNALDMVTAMRGVTYDWKTNEASREEVVKNADPVYISEPDKKAEKLQSHTGFIAQEIQSILPSAVSEIQEKDSTGAIIGTTLGVDYISVIPVLVEAIKELRKELETMKTAMAMNTNTPPVQQTIYNAPPVGANSMSAGKTNSNNLSVKDAVKLLEDNLSFMTKEHQEQMKDFIKEIKSSDKLTPDQLSKVLEFRNNIKEFQKNK